MSVVPFDYDTDPSRGGKDADAKCLRADQAKDVHEGVAGRLAAEGVHLVIDVGGGRGRLRPFLPDSVNWVGVDLSPTQLRDAPGPVVRGDATRLPVRSGSVDAVTSLWMLYHLAEPRRAIAEAHRVLKPGGVFVACTTRRDDSSEVMPPRPPTTFDAEEAPAIVREVFGCIDEVEAWDEQMLELPDRESVCRYLISRFADPALADAVPTPVRVTKRGCLVWARKRTRRP